MIPLQHLGIPTEGYFEKKIFNLFDFQKVLIDESIDPDIKFFSFSDKSEALGSPYCSTDEFSSSFQKVLKNSFSILHINVRS